MQHQLITDYSYEVGTPPRFAHPYHLLPTPLPLHRIVSSKFSGPHVLSEIVCETMSSQEVTANIAEMEETVTRISSHKGVEGVMIMNRQGVFEY